MCQRATEKLHRGQPSLRSKLTCGYKTWQVVCAAFSCAAVKESVVFYSENKAFLYIIPSCESPLMLHPNQGAGEQRLSHV